MLMKEKSLSDLNMPKVSIIVPVYGVESYIEKCVRSLFEQTLEDIEFIFVDDCTKDRSIEILNSVLKEYPNREKQVSILKHDCNKGLPIARYTGVKASKGEYIFHCDSDDWVSLDMCETLYNVATEKKTDILICDYFVENGNKTVIARGCSNEKSKEEILRNMFPGKVPFMVWNKFVKSDLYKNNIMYPTETHAEDMALVIQLCYYAKSIYYQPKAYYHYKVDSNTALHRMTDDLYLRNFYQSIKNAILLENFFKNKMTNKLIYEGIEYAKLIQRDRLLPLIQQPKYFNLWLSTFPEVQYNILLNSSVSLVHKIKYVIIRMHLYCLIRKFVS